MWGCKIVLSSRKQTHVDEAVEEFRKSGFEAVGIVCHAAKSEDRAKLIELALQEYGRIDYVVANAAVSTFMGFMGVDRPSLDKLWDVNVFAAFLLVKETFPHLKKNPGSSVVFVSTVAAWEMHMTYPHYCISKLAMSAMAKALAKEMEGDGIRVNIVSPGLIRTEFSICWSIDFH